MASALAQDSAAPDFRRLSLSADVDRDGASSPFPSPGSSFFPPPRLGAHEFAAASSSAMRNASARTSAGALSPVPQDQQATTPTQLKPARFSEGAPSPVTPTQRASFQEDGMGSILSLGTGSGKYAEPSSNPQITIPEPPNTPSVAEPPPSPAPSLTSSRPAPPSPAASRRTSAALSRRSSGARSRQSESRRQSKVPSLAPQHEGESSSSSAAPATPSPTTPTTATPADADAAAAPKRRSLLSKIRDFAFPPDDERHAGRGTHVPRANRPRHRSSVYSGSSSSSSSADNDEDTRGSWGTFRWNTFSQHFWGSNADGEGADGGPSQTDFARNFATDSAEAGGDEAEDDDDDEESYEDADEGADGPLVPGLYRALFAFEPEGTAEMALEEEQVVRVIGRGGGVGWAVVQKEGGGHALVPESYLELVEADSTGA